MILAAGLILDASLLRIEARLSHIRKDFEARDDANWLVWLDAVDQGGAHRFGPDAVVTRNRDEGESK